MHSGMTEEQWDSMIAAQATWDATMAHNAVKALREHGGPEGVMVVLAGSGHVAYGARHPATGQDSTFRGHLDRHPRQRPRRGRRRGQGGPGLLRRFRLGHAGVERAALSRPRPLDGAGEGEKALKVIFVSEKTPAGKAGFKAGDVLLTMDGAPVPDKETLNRLVAGKSWGDESSFDREARGRDGDPGVAFRR